MHTVIDDHTRIAYAEIHDDETAATAIAVLRRAVAWFTARGVTVERALSDNGSAYRSQAWRDAGRYLRVVQIVRLRGFALGTGRGRHGAVAGVLAAAHPPHDVGHRADAVTVG